MMEYLEKAANWLGTAKYTPAQFLIALGAAAFVITLARAAYIAKKRPGEELLFEIHTGKFVYTKFLGTKMTKEAE